MLSLSLAGVGLALVSVAWLHYLWLIPRERFDRAAIGHRVIIGLGTLLATAAAVVVGLTPSDLATTLSTGATSAFTVVVGAFHFFLVHTAGADDGPPAFKLGERLPAFDAVTDTGAPFSSDALLGQRTVLKFFRGHW